MFLFASEVSSLKEPVIDDSVPAAEAIVVLTGGSDRLATGITLLAAGKGKKLLISGVPYGLTLNNILAKYAVPQETRDCCIVIGHAADNTLGNAEETRAWMKKEGFRSLRLVTANYHMPRSLLVFRRALPGIDIFAHPVSPDSVKMSDWWLRPGTAGLLMTEYNKYIYAILSFWSRSGK